MTGTARSVYTAAAAGLAVGLVWGYAFAHRIITPTPIVRDPRWAIYVVPPCASRPINLQAVGLTYHAAYAHAADLIPPEKDRPGRGIDVRVGGAVCP